MSELSLLSSVSQVLNEFWRSLCSKPQVKVLIQQLGPLREQWNSNPRLQVAVWIILGLMLINIITVAYRWQSSQLDELENSAQKLKKMESLVGQSIWSQRAISAVSGLEAREKRLWRTDSAALARADLQAWLEQQVDNSGIGKSRFDVLQLAESPIDGIGELHASISGEYTPESLSKLLIAIEGASQQVVINALDVNNRTRQFFSLQLVAYFEISSVRLEGGL